MSIMRLLDVTIKYSFCRDWHSLHIFKPYFTFIYSHVSPSFFRYPVKCVLTFNIFMNWVNSTSSSRYMFAICYQTLLRKRLARDISWGDLAAYCSGLLRVFILSMKAEGTLTFDVGEEQKPPPRPLGGVKDGLNETRLMPYLRPKPEKWDRFKAKTKPTSLSGAHKTSLNRFPNRNR